MSLINLIGLAANDPVPGNYVDVKFAQGNASNGNSVYSAILQGNKLAGGSAQVDGYVYGSTTNLVMDSENDCIGLFGAGSEVHRGFKEFRSINVTTPLFAIAVAEGVSATAATGTITITGTATAAATLRLFIEDVQVDVGIAAGDTPSVIGDNAVLAVQAITYVSSTIANSSGVLTLTAKNKGLRGNNKRYSAIMLGTGQTTTVTPTNRTLFTGGTVQDSNANALATIASSRYYYNVTSADDSANLGRLSAQMDSTSAPIVGLRQRTVAANVGASLASVITLATGINNPRVELGYQMESDKSAMQLAANLAAVYSLMESALGDQSTLNYNGFGLDPNSARFWSLPAAVSGAKMSRVQIASCLNSGITPIGTNVQGQTSIVRRVTTRSLSGGTPDYRIRDACKVTVSDRFADDLVNQASLRFAGKVVGNDPLPGQRRPGSQVVTPNLFKAMAFDLVNEYANEYLLDNVADILAGINCVRETSPATRISCRIPLKVIDILNQTATEIDEVSTG